MDHILKKKKRIRRIFIYTLCIMIILPVIVFIVIHHWGGTGGTTTTTTVMAGCPTSTGCMGRGICSGLATGGISDTFEVNASKDTVILSFNLNQDTTVAPFQGQFFRTSPTTYTFDVPFDCSSFNPIFHNGQDFWPLIGRYIIPCGVPFEAVYNPETGTETITIPIKQSAPTNMNIVFGGGAGGTYNPASQGVFSCTHNPTLQQGNVPRSIPITFALQQGCADTLLMYFRLSDFNGAYPNPNPQRPFWLSPVPGNYGITGLPLLGPDFAFLFLPENAMINGMGRISRSTTHDTLHIPYTYSCFPAVLTLDPGAPNACVVRFTDNSVSVDLTNAGKCLFYQLTATMANGTRFQAISYSASTAIAINGLEPGAYTIELKKVQANNTTSCQSNAINVVID